MSGARDGRPSVAGGVGAGLVGGDLRQGGPGPGLDPVGQGDRLLEGAVAVVDAAGELQEQEPRGSLRLVVPPPPLEDDAGAVVDAVERDGTDPDRCRLRLHRLFLQAPGCRRLCRSFLAKISYRDA